MMASQRFRISVLRDHLRGLRSTGRLASVPTSEPTPAGGLERHHRELEEKGYTVLDVGEFCDAEMFDRLRAAGRRVVQAAREMPAKETNLNGAFVLRDSPGEGPWGIRGLIAPELKEPVFAEYMSSEPVLRQVKAFMGCGPDDLMLADADALIFCNPPGVDRAQYWHRDTRWWGLDTSGGRSDTGLTGGVVRDAAEFDEESEKARWAEIQAGPQGRWAKGEPRVSGHNTYLANNGGCYFRWELALEEQTTGLEIVPGSHRRWRTDFERDCLVPRRARAQAGLPREVLPGASSKAMSDGGHGGESVMPGAIFVHLLPGQSVIWNGDALHRGRTVKGVERMTLSCSYSRWNGCFVPPPPVIDPTLEWRLRPEIREALPAPWMQQAWDRWLLTQYSPEQISAKFPGLMPIVHDGRESDATACWERLRVAPSASASA